MGAFGWTQVKSLARYGNIGIIHSFIHLFTLAIYSLQGFHLNKVYCYSFYTFTFKTFKTNNGSFGLIPALED